jgi:hypothetical protein
MPLIWTIFTFAKSALAAVLQLLGEMLSTRAGQLILAVIVAFFLGHKLAADDCAGRIAAEELRREQAAQIWREKVAAEQQRRDLVIEQAARQARQDADELEIKEAQIEKLQKEIDYASHANDHRPGLDSRSVQRLKRLAH